MTALSAYAMTAITAVTVQDTTGVHSFHPVPSKIVADQIRVVLSEVPLSDAGVGSGVFTTTQQVALALGVATLGTLFVSLAPAARFGTLHAAVLILGLQALVAAGIAIGSRGLKR